MPQPSSASPTYASVVSKHPDDRASAALATVAASLQNSLGLNDIRLLSAGLRINQLESFLGLASMAGFRAWAMEGGYDDLPSVELPLVLVLKDSEPRAEPNARGFSVLHQVSPDSAWIADPTTGLQKISRSELESIWTGDVVALERDPAAEQETLQELERKRNPRGRRLWLGAMLLVWGLTSFFLLNATGVAKVLLLSALALALSAALWSSLEATSCAVCNQAKKLVGGLPVAAAGCFFYLALWMSSGLFPSHSMIPTALVVALGVHGALLRILYRHRLSCSPCLTTAGAALVAGGAAMAGHEMSIENVLLWAVLGICSFWTSTQALRFAREVFSWRRRAAAFELARENAADPAGQDLPAGKAHMVVYKRPGCIACAIFDATVRPGLEEAFGERLSIEIRRPEDSAVPTPLVMISGNGVTRAVDVQEQEQPFERLSGAISAALGAPSAKESSFVWVA